MNADLVFKARAFGIIACAERAIRIDEKLRHQKQRDALGARRCIGQARQHEMDDIVRHVVVAIGDENLGAGDLVGAIALRHGLGLQGVEIGTGLRFGEVHRAGPFARNELGQIERLLLVCAMDGNGLHRALRKNGAKTESHVGGVPHLLHCGGERQGQALTTMFGCCGDGAPAAIDPLAIGIGKAGGGLDAIVSKPDAFDVAGFVQRGEHIACELCAFFEHGLDEVRRQIRKIALPCKRIEPHHFIEKESHVANGGTIGHKRTFRS